MVSDPLWAKFCALFGLDALWADESLRVNNQRVLARERLIPVVRDLLKGFTKAELIAKLETSGLPFAPIGKPEELFDDPHLLATGGLVDVTLPGGEATRLPSLPVEMDGRRFTENGALATPGQHSRAILSGLGFSDSETESLVADGVVETT